MTTRYVDAVAGNDSTGTGTLAAPWKTSGKAVGAAVAGDVIVFRGGASTGTAYAYGGFWTNKNLTLQNYPNEHVNFTDPTRAQVITFESLTAGGISVQGSGSIRIGDAKAPASQIDTTTGEAALQLTGGSGLLFDGGPNNALKIESFADFGIRTTGTSTIPYTKSCTFRHMEILHNGIGIRISGEGTDTVAPTGGSGCVIEYCNIHDNDRMVQRSTASTNDDFGALGIDLFKCTGVTVRYNTIANNFSTVAANGTPPSPDYGVDGGAIETFGSTNCSIHHNTIYGNEGIWEMGTSAGLTIPTGNTFRYNLCYGTIDPLPAYSGSDSPAILARAFRNGAIEHNVFDIDSGNDVIRIDPSTSGWGAGVDGGVIRNNIFVARGSNQRCVDVQGALPSTFVLDYNLYYQPTTPTTAFQSPSGTTGTIASFRTATGQEAHGLYGDPLFTDRTGRDYTVGGTSPAVNNGVVIPGVNDGYTGGAPDIGAYEQPAPGFTGIAQDLFDRTVGAGGWGTSSSGHAWTVAGAGGGTATDFSVAGGLGVMAASTTATTHVATLGIPATLGIDLTGRCAPSKVAAGDAFRIAADLRYIDSSNSYRFFVEMNSGGSAVQVRCARIIGGVSTDVIPLTTVAGLAQAAGRFWRFRFQAQHTPANSDGSDPEKTTLRMKAWQDGTAEPATWFATVDDSTAALQTALGLRLRTEVGSSSTAGAMTFSWDDLLVSAVAEGTPATPTPTPTPVPVPASALDVLVHDSGWVTSPATAYVLPAGMLKTGETYRWTVDVEDTDGLTATLG